MTGSRSVVLAAVLVLIVSLAAGARVARAQDANLYDPEVVREYELNFDTPDWEAALTAAGDTGNAPADLVVGDESLDQVGVRYKGLSSMFVRSRKKPLNVTTDAYVPGQRLLGFDAINLNNGYSDPSFLREALITELVRPFMPAQRTAYAKVHVNDEYLGLYLAVEQVEGTFLSHWFPDSDGILIKADPPAGPGMGARTFHSSLEWEGENLDAYRPLYEVKTDGAEEAGLTAIREAARVLDAPVSAGGATDADLPGAVSDVLDVDRALWYLAANNLFVNYDSYYFGHNYFLFLSEDDQLLHFLLWDTSLSFGDLDLGAWESGGAGPRVDPFAMEDSDIRPVLRRLLAVPEWRADYAAHYRVLLDHAFDPGVLAERGAALQALARPGLETDPNRLFTLAQFDRNLNDEVTTRTNMGPGGRAPGILSFVREREAWLQDLPALAGPDHQLVVHTRLPDVPQANDPANVAVGFDGADSPASVRLVYRVDRGRPQAIELSKDLDFWEGAIPGQAPMSEVTYYVRAEFADGRSAFYPQANLTQAWRYTVLGPDLPLEPDSPLVINEIMADNDTTIVDEAGEFDDWIELHNRGTASVPLDGLFLSDDAEDPWAFALPDMSLEPGAHVVVWCDNDPEQGPLHATFALSRAGESIVLSSSDAVLDEHAFDAQSTDVSLARVPDGDGAWITCESPTPGEANRCTNEPAVTPSPTDVATAAVTPTATISTPGPTNTPEPGEPKEYAVYLPSLRK